MRARARPSACVHRAVVVGLAAARQTTAGGQPNASAARSLRGIGGAGCRSGLLTRPSSRRPHWHPIGSGHPLVYGHFMGCGHPMGLRGHPMGRGHSMACGHYWGAATPWAPNPRNPTGCGEPFGGGHPIACGQRMYCGIPQGCGHRIGCGHPLVCGHPHGLRRHRRLRPLHGLRPLAAIPWTAPGEEQSAELGQECIAAKRSQARRLRSSTALRHQRMPAHCCAATCSGAALHLDWTYASEGSVHNTSGNTYVLF